MDLENQYRMQILELDRINLILEANVHKDPAVRPYQTELRRERNRLENLQQALILARTLPLQ